MKSHVWVIACIATLLSPAAFAAAPVDTILPVQGLVITNTMHTSYIVFKGGPTHTYNGLDTENWFLVDSNTPKGINYRIRISVPGNAEADTRLKGVINERRVRHEDIAQSARMTLLFSSFDPPVYAGQTFAEASTKTLNLLKSGMGVPFVLGLPAKDDLFGALGLLGTLPGGDNTNSSAKGGPSPAALAHALQLFSSGRNYFRGTLQRVEATPVALPVLLNGIRTTLPAIHAAGVFKFGSQLPVKAEFWWLDNPAYPLTLKWMLASEGDVVGHEGRASQQVTRIDLPSDSGGSGAGQGAAQIAAQLDGKSCHAELSGIYFNTDSSQLLPESQPALKSIAQAIKQSREPVLTIGGHTDDIGAAAHNQDLSEKRAAAVRQVLIAQFGLAAGRLVAKGYGLTHPVESNDTVEGRAHNRRVELSRPCAG